MSVTLGERLAELLEDAYMSADALGKKIGVSGSIVARWIRENKPIKLFNLLKIAEHFECCVDYLCGRTEHKGKFSTVSPTFPARFVSLLESSGEAKDKVMLKMGLGIRTEYNWKHGVVPLSTSLIAVADYFDVSIDYLLGI